MLLLLLSTKDNLLNMKNINNLEKILMQIMSHYNQIKFLIIMLVVILIAKIFNKIDDIL